MNEILKLIEEHFDYKTELIENRITRLDFYFVCLQKKDISVSLDKRLNKISIHNSDITINENSHPADFISIFGKPSKPFLENLSKIAKKLHKMGEKTSWQMPRYSGQSPSLVFKGENIYENIANNDGDLKDFVKATDSEVIKNDNNIEIAIGENAWIVLNKETYEISGKIDTREFSIQSNKNDYLDDIKKEYIVTVPSSPIKIEQFHL